MITTLLIANRGEIASRVIRTAREMDIRTVAVYSDADADAPFVHEADEAVALPGVSPAETYLRGDLVIEAALRTGADAIHPGYGFLSENAGFARACAQAGIVFVGPPPAAIDAMGSKTEAKALMARAGVPVLDGLVIDAGADAAELLTDASSLHFPVLVKAAFGGGGRGMRIVRSAADLPEAVASAQREAASAFGDGTVFLEHYVERPRHIEVQVFADTHGNVVHLFERECSIQRRYQKIIEEAPSSAVSDELREQLGQAAVEAARAIGYVGAGTVEFVMDQEGAFFFLEVNTRLQVEHPVTEMVTGTDLVRAQLLVAEGEPLPPEVLHPVLTGHAVEVRLYAEDATAGFRPTPGTVSAVSFASGEGIRVDGGVTDGTVVSQYYDPMLAKVIAYAPTRDLAVRRLARALADTRIDGVVTNRDLLIAILREEEFRAGAIDTGYLERHDPAELSRSVGSGAVQTHAVAAALAEATRRHEASPVLPTVPIGWRNVPSAPSTVDYEHGGEPTPASYRITGAHALVTVGGTAHTVQIHGGDVGDLTVDGVRRRYRVARHGAHVFVSSSLGVTTLEERARFHEPGAATAAGSLVAPMPGTVVRVAVEAGQEVEHGQVVAVMEAMKMEHTITAPHAGIVASIDVSPGSTVEAGSVLAVIEEHEQDTEA